MLYNEGSNDWEHIVKSQADHEYLFSHYLGHRFQIGKAFNSPLREDNVPSFTIFEGANGLMYKDFKTGESGDVIKFVSQLFKISRENAVIKCLSDAFTSILSDDLIEVMPKYHSSRKDTVVSLKTIDFNKSDLDYWNQFGITKKTLDLYEVVAVSHVWFNDKLSWIRTDTQPIYAYLVDGKIKVYRPLTPRKDGKWAGNSNNSCIFGIDNLPLNGELLIITKSLKDVMTLYELGYNVIAPNAETTLLTYEQIENLQKRFDRIVIFLDNDEAGLRAATKYKEKYELEFIVLPGEEKDISDYIRVHGKEAAEVMMKSLLNKNENRN